MSAEVFGRDAELRHLGAFIDRLASGPAGLVLAGDAGSGKSTLLRAGAELAADRGFAVSQTTPARSDVRLAFAGLADLLEPYLPGVLEDLAAPMARALRVALLLEEAPPHPPEPRLIAAAFRAAMAALARSASVLLVIDDVQWLDPASEAVIGFAVRRAEHDAIGLLCAQRTDRPGADLPLELARARLQADLLAVGGLSLGALHRMLRTRLGASFSHPALRRIEAGSGGNPFIALEIGRALVRRGIGGGPVAELPVPDTLSELVGERLGALAPEVIDALRLVAVIPELPAGLYVSAGAAAAALDTVVLAGVLEDHSGRAPVRAPAAGRRGGRCHATWAQAGAARGRGAARAAARGKGPASGAGHRGPVRGGRAGADRRG